MKIQRIFKRRDKADKLVRRFDNSVEALTDIWKTKYVRRD